MSINVTSKETPIIGYRTPEYLRRIVPKPIALEQGMVPLAIQGEELVLASDRTFSSSQKQKLERRFRYPVQLINVSMLQLRRLQTRLYENQEPHPPHLSAEQLFQTLGLEHLHGLLPEGPVNGALENCDFTFWLQRGWITGAQWSQLMAAYHYLPNKVAVQPNALNALLEFIDIDPILRRERQCFLPLWWANRTLVLGVSDLNAIDAINALTADWPCQTVPILIPERTLNDLKKSFAGKTLKAVPIRDQQIAKRLLQKDKVTDQEVQAALTLSRQMGLNLVDALSEAQPGIRKTWLEEKASLLGSLAIHEEELPDNFAEVLSSLFEIIPQEICKMLGVLPLNFMNEVLIVGMAEFHPGAIKILEEVSGYVVEPRLMADEVIRRWVERSSSTSTKLPNFHIGVSEIEAYLLSSHLVQASQLRRLDLPKTLSNHTYFGKLISAGLLSDEDVAQIYATLYQIPYLSLDNVQIDEELVQQFSQTLLKDHRILPLVKHGESLWVAIARPLQGEGLRKLEEATQLTLWPFIVPEQALERALSQVLNLSATDKSNPHLASCVKFLAKKGLIPKTAIDQIIHEVVENDRVFDHVVREHLIESKHNLYEVFAEFRSVPFVSLKPQIEIQEMIDPLGNKVRQSRTKDPVDATTARRLDYEAARRLGALPVSEKNDVLRVAFASPLFDSAIEELEGKFEEQLEPVMVTREELDQAIERILGRQNIGTLLVNSGMITRHQLNDALNLAESTHTHIGQALVHRGYITENQLYSFLSKQLGIPLFDLSKVKLSKTAAQTFSPDEEWEWGILPLAKDDQKLIVGMIDPVNQDALKFIRERTDLEIVPVLITENDFENALETLYKEHYTARSVSALLSRSPENSAAQVLTKQQAIWMIVFAVAMAGLAIWNFKNFLIGLNAVFTLIYMSMVVYKFYLIANAIGSDLEVPITDEELEALRDDELPVYTILIPVYKEAAVLPSLLTAVENLNYPKIKLDVKVLLEEDDTETIEAFHNFNPPDFMQGLIVPTSQPKTKPKACNYGLIRAKGELIVIFDAEDQPDPDQLKKVVVAFKKSPANVICMQAKLNYFNRQQNLLTQWFSSEYSMWFDLFLPGLDARNVPIPLGGTSNHFKKFALIEAGAWDPHNMTEDADLGIRLYKLGYRTKIVDTTTYEEANSDVKNWIRQRSRWVKGHIQTWLVHMRHPFQLIKDIGLKAFFSFQMVVGGNIFTVIFNPIYWIITFSWLLFRFDFISALFPGPINILGAFSLYFGNFAFTYMNVAGAMGRGYYDMVKTTLLSPLYWGLMSIGGWRGFIQIITKPHYWEKTVHGLSDDAVPAGQEENQA